MSQNKQDQNKIINYSQFLETLDQDDFKKELKGFYTKKTISKLIIIKKNNNLDFTKLAEVILIKKGQISQENKLI